jgi:hypothetical protein
MRDHSHDDTKSNVKSPLASLSPVDETVMVVGDDTVISQKGAIDCSGEEKVKFWTTDEVVALAGDSS